MQNHSKILAFGLLLLLLLPEQGLGAEAYREGRLVMGGYLGVGYAKLGDDVPGEDNTAQGVGGNFRIGYGMSPSLFVGVETSAWQDFDSSSEGDTEISFKTFGPSVAFYPGAKGFYLRGIVGWSWLDLDLQPAGSPKYHTEASGWGAAASMGFEWRVTPSVAIGPQVDLGYMDVGEVESLSTTLGESFPFSATWVNFTLFVVLYI